MSLLSDVMRYGTDVVLLNERVERLTKEYAAATARLEDHERRLVRIETLFEFLMKPPGGAAAPPRALPPD